MKVFLFCLVTYLVYFAIGIAISAIFSLGPWSQILLGSVIAVFWIIGNELFKEKQRDS